MSHPTFEVLIFDRGRLDAEDARRLADHLKRCPACQQMASAWGETEALLASQELASPSPGFEARFLHRLQARRQRRQSLVLHLLVLSLVGGLFGLGVLFGAQLARAWISIVTELMGVAVRLLNIGSMLSLALKFVFLLAEQVIESLPIPAWLALSASFSALLALWLGSAWRFMHASIRKEI